MNVVAFPKNELAVETRLKAIFSPTEQFAAKNKSPTSGIEIPE
jgi:hypothetical protein